MTNNVEHLFMSLFDICVSFFEKCLCSFLNGVICLLLNCKLLINSASRYVPQFGGSSFHLLDDTVCSMKVFHFDVIQFICFFFCCLYFWYHI